MCEKQSEARWLTSTISLWFAFLPSDPVASRRQLQKAPIPRGDRPAISAARVTFQAVRYCQSMGGKSGLAGNGEAP